MNVNHDHHTDGLVQERHNSSALAMELCLSCINPSIQTCGFKVALYIVIIIPGSKYPRINIDQTSIWHFYIRFMSQRCWFKRLCYLELWRHSIDLEYDIIGNSCITFRENRPQIRFMPEAHNINPCIIFIVFPVITTWSGILINDQLSLIFWCLCSPYYQRLIVSCHLLF